MWGAGTRISGNVTRTTKGHAISEFYGYKVNGFYENVDEVLALPPLGQEVKSAEDAKAWVGKFKFADTDGMVSWMEMTAPLSVPLIRT